MKGLMCILGWLCLAGTCAAQAQPDLCPRHIETPLYPEIARTAHLAGKVVIVLTINSDGGVSEAKVANHEKPMDLLERYTLSNVRQWTFAKPPTVPYTDTVTYDYELDESSRGQESRVSFDLPDRVTILSDLPIINTSQSKKRH